MNPITHIAIIMDGNGRWALKKNKPRNYGHKIGLKNIKNIIELCAKKKIKFLTLYVFSVDNWKRSKKEVFFLFDLLTNYLKKYLNYLIKNKIRIKFLGENKKLKKSLIHYIKKVDKNTSKKYDITINLAFNYSSKIEILNAANILIKKRKKITMNLFSKNLYTNTMPDPEILIRTGGYSRLSDFLLWQIAYSEIFFIKKLWPDFTIEDLKKIIAKFKKIQRNFGDVNVKYST
jgi:undecaprenyl diphosphate synthase